MIKKIQDHGEQGDQGRQSEQERFPKMMGVDLNRLILSPYEIWKRDNRIRPEDMN